MSPDARRQLVTVALFLATVAVNGAANALPINGLTTGEITDRFSVYVIPAGYVFSIWGVIYLLLGGQTRWFLMATLVTIALRITYRPFIPR